MIRLILFLIIYADPETIKTNELSAGVYISIGIVIGIFISLLVILPPVVIVIWRLKNKTIRSHCQSQGEPICVLLLCMREEWAKDSCPHASPNKPLTLILMFKGIVSQYYKGYF